MLASSYFSRLNLDDFTPEELDQLRDMIESSGGTRIQLVWKPRSLLAFRLLRYIHTYIYEGGRALFLPLI